MNGAGGVSAHADRLRQQDGWEDVCECARTIMTTTFWMGPPPPGAGLGAVDGTQKHSLYLPAAGSLPNAADVHGIDPVTVFVRCGAARSWVNVTSSPEPGKPDTNLAPK